MSCGVVGWYGRDGVVWCGVAKAVQRINKAVT